jgi:hypothetical protein
MKNRKFDKISKKILVAVIIFLSIALVGIIGYIVIASGG